MTAPLTLYVDDQWTSPYAFSNFVALREKRLAFDTVEVSLPRRETRAPEFLRRSLTGRLPMLRHGDEFLSESSAINEYLEDVFPPPAHPRLFPAEAVARGRARQLMAWVRSDLMPIREERPTSALFYDHPVKALSPAALDHAQRLLDVASSLLADDRPSLFAEWSIADADFALVLNRLVKHGHPVPPKVRRYVDATWRRPSIREWVDRPRKPFVSS